ncbi:SIFV.gp54-like protein [Sulfolobus islandicus filamentous virus 2]|uniref:SIFV.gp54-like protein n=1 Tax=Sulfolobus islandicus filamentous virus 2 TaxID=1902331 RepID=A0A1D8BJA8_SIFV|nr:SIFV.gp54-like protein [Sulfolobus islandicus filamentous virus 2]
MSSVTQPAYTEAFMSVIATSVSGVNVSQYPSPSGYHVYLSSQTGIVDNTTNVSVYNVSDTYQNNNEVTSVTFIAVFTNLNSYTFNEILFYTQVNGQDFMQVAQFIPSSAIQKSSGYALVITITLSIATPIYTIDAIQDVQQLCTQYCTNVNCNTVGGNIETSYLPFSLFNLVFLYLLGINTNTIEQSPSTQQTASLYANCINSCVQYCSTNRPLECVACLSGCHTYLLENPLFTFLLANNIQNIVELLPQGINTIYAVNVCSGKVATLTPQNFQNNLNVVSQSEIQYTTQFYLQGTNELFNALQIMVSTLNTNYNYSLGVLYFTGVPLPSGETFILEVTMSES